MLCSYLIYYGLLLKAYSKDLPIIFRGANPHVTDKEGNTPLKLASEPSNEIVALLTSR